jgi:hypothetical protein
MFLFAAVVGCAGGIHIEGTVKTRGGEVWENPVTVDVFAADDVGVDGAVPFDSTHDARFDFGVPAGHWVVTGAAGTCHGDSAVSGTDGEFVRTTIEMICVE